jgi:hypothetical protein
MQLRLLLPTIIEQRYREFATIGGNPTEDRAATGTAVRFSMCNESTYELRLSLITRLSPDLRIR